ncbi:hypothetical protein [Siccirubricoccus sp. G192]|uniref:hypothetical protein n=1 Tax=Siccirubricoccus sp. G192 TaxID=2849651 RepID=UPI001C2C0438|nr:hypothetical protein [Siccirubricoccus sp. G192]MBV1797000.1 hypothetical protein [Siccirubricoccus sp. G192]
MTPLWQNGLRAASAMALRHLSWRGGPEAAGPVTPPDPALPPGPPPGPPPGAARADWADRLWQEGFALPGGEAEVQRLAGLLPLSPATTLLLLGHDAGGAAGCIARGCGAWVAAHHCDPLLAGRMEARLRPLGRRVAVQPWDPAAPQSRARYHHHALALEPLRAGADPARLLAAIAAALKPGAQLVLLDFVAKAAPPDQAMRRWMQLEARAAPPPDQAALEAALAAAGFHLHVAEDAGTRHCAAALEAWARLIGGLRGPGRPPSTAAAAGLIAEAEAWLLRQRLLGSGALRLFRWHASLAAT